MNIDVKDIITLNDNNQYVVVSKVNYENNTYYYLSDINDSSNLKFCVEKENNILNEITDSKLNQFLLPLFLSQAQDYIRKDLEELNS